jgi:predicted ABC-type ATPase
MSKKRLRIFAGPNGSGKSTIFKHVDSLIGCYSFVNADEIQKSLSEKGMLNFDKYTIVADKEALLDDFLRSSWIKNIVHREEICNSIRIESNKLYVDPQLVDGYFAAYIADFVRKNMLNVVHQFTIETVLSDCRKLDYIKSAKSLGYRIYLYFVATKDVEINIQRVRQRVKSGGHDVPEDKIRARYNRALENLFETLKLCDRAYLFDNSDEKWVLLAELDGDRLELKQDVIPNWLHTYVLSKISVE